MFGASGHLYFTPATDIHTQSNAQPSIRLCLPKTKRPPSCIFQSTLPVGWGVFSWPGTVSGRGVAPCPLRGDLGEIRVFVAVAGEGLAGGVQVEWCPRPGHSALPVGSSWKRAGNSRGWGSPRGLPGQPLAQLPRRWGFLGGSPASRWLCPWPGAVLSQSFPSLGAGPPAPQGESPLRGGSGLLGTEPVQTVYVGAGGWDRGRARGAGMA